MKLSQGTIIPLIVVATLVATFQGCTKGEAGQSTKNKPATNEASAAAATVKVVVAKVNERPFEDWGSYSADLRGAEDANLVAPFQGGRVNSLKQVGTWVKAGQSLCDIDGDKYGAALEAAKAQVEVTRGDMERAKVNVENGSIGRSALDGTNLAYQNARMNLATAQRAWEDCQCQAPFEGVLVSRSIEKYQTVAPNVPTVRLSRIDHLEAVIAIPETEAFSYQEGMKAEFRLLQDHTMTPYDGRITSIDRAVDTRSRTVAARILIANPKGTLRPGMVGRARILRKSFPKAVVIPSTALVRLQNGISVMVVENNVARQRIVQVGASAEDSTLITEGLHAGDNLIVTGAFQVSEGTKVSY
jgi:membrane fusion protein, multidrug efflux system